MSLLMDALRRAEQAKRQAEGVGNPAPSEIDRSSRATPGDTPGGQKASLLPDPPAGLELLDDNLGLPSPLPQPPEAEPKREQEAVQNLFAVKEVSTRRPFYLVVGGLTALAVIAIGVYFWLQLRPSSIAATPAASAPRPLAAPQTPPSAPRAVAALEPAHNMPVAAVRVPDSAAPEGLAARATNPIAPKVAARPVAAERPAKKPAAEDEERAIRISSPKLTVNPLLTQAYDAFQTGNMSAARQHYEQVIRTEPKNVTALLGLAAIALTEGRPERAEAYYSRAAEADPMNAAAQAGLLNLRPAPDPVQAESRIKTLLANQPDAPALLFALGNVYAQQNRWHEAQQAYFQAYTGDSENGDYLYNLAVSLDQLRQPRLALEYYQSALAAAARRPASFNRDLAARRVRELQP